MDGRRRWSRQVAALPGVADVRYDREWLGRLASGLDAVRGAGLALALLMAVAAALTVAAVVRLGLHARRDEIEIMKLVGSPMTFIRGPFVAEGLLQGGIGARPGAGGSCGWGSRSPRRGGAASWPPCSTGRRCGSCRCAWRRCSSREGWWWGLRAALPRRATRDELQAGPLTARALRAVYTER